MPDENKSSGVEAKVDILLGQTSKIFETVNEMAVDAASHRATVSGQFDLLSERQDVQRGDHEALEQTVKAQGVAHAALANDTPSQKKIMGALVIGVPLLGGIFTWVGKVWEAAKHGGG